MDLSALGRLLIVIALVMLIVGVALVLLGKVPFLGRLPGDITIRRDGFTIFFPIVAMIILSVLLTIVLNVAGRWWR